MNWDLWKKRQARLNFGVAVTTHDRRNVFSRTYYKLIEHTPLSVPIFVVDDGSKIPTPLSHWRNEESKGIAWAKNKSLELLMNSGVEHLFLFDDDCYPIKDEWWVPYMESGEHHLSFLHSNRDKDSRVIYDDGQLWAMDRGTGCMLYYTRKCIEVVGGMRTAFGRWSFEHIEHSQRIHNAGLTKFPFQDIHQDGLYSMDEHEAIDPSINRTERRKDYARNKDLYENYYKNKEPEFVDYVMS